MAGKSWWKGPVKAEPNFGNLLKVLKKQKPDRPTLFEFFLNRPLYLRIAGREAEAWVDQKPYGTDRMLVRAFRNAGYDYATVGGSEFSFPAREVASKNTRSLNDGAVITDRKSFETYKWPNPDNCDYSRLEALAADLPDGMKLIVCGPMGVLENVIKLVGYDTMCYLIADDPELLQEICDSIGSRLVRHYELSLEHDTVGAIISNDDWGFKTQPMMAPDDMRKFIVPWHRKIIDTAHKAGRPVILHACGQLKSLMDDIIGIGYDGKHSYEDTILPVEQAYEQYSGRIAIMGGLDMDFVVRSAPEQIYKRAKAMLERSAQRGSFALGTGNSVPEYVPQDNYFAMTAAAIESR